MYKSAQSKPRNWIHAKWSVEWSGILSCETEKKTAVSLVSPSWTLLPGSPFVWFFVCPTSDSLSCRLAQRRYLQCKPRRSEGWHLPLPS